MEESYKLGLKGEEIAVDYLRSSQRIVGKILFRGYNSAEIFIAVKCVIGISCHFASSAFSDLGEALDFFSVTFSASFSPSISSDSAAGGFGIIRPTVLISTSYQVVEAWR